MITNTAFNQSLCLPDFQIACPNEPRQESLMDKLQNRIEKKLVVNIAFLVACQDSRTQAVTSATDCFSEAFGLDVGFSDLGL
jgi:hypothetical protein